MLRIDKIIIISRCDCPLPSNDRLSSHPKLWLSTSSEHPPLLSHCQYLPCWPIVVLLLSQPSAWHLQSTAMLLPRESWWAY